jgi:hypothetical protein
MWLPLLHNPSMTGGRLSRGRMPNLRRQYLTPHKHGLHFQLREMRQLRERTIAKPIGLLQDAFFQERHRSTRIKKERQRAAKISIETNALRLIARCHLARAFV